ncbi:MAG TPA: transketolase [Firmicutes bacterium]|jgi:transketolase|nr:transketolase [Bacillota bacterium]
MKAIVAPRDIFGQTLMEIGAVNERLFVVNADLSGATKTDKFRARFGERFINVGISEQNMAGVAAGATHQSLDDLALMRALPNMTVLAPSDQVETRKAVLKAVEHKGPVYLRIGRMGCPVFFREDTEFEIGKAYVLKEGTDVTLIAHGSMVGVIYEAALLLEKKGVQARVVDMPTLKPIDEATIIRSAQETKVIVTAEDHFLYGGLYSAVCEVVAGLTPVRGIAVRDRFGESGAPEELFKKYGLTAEKVVEEVIHVFNKSGVV